MHIKDLRSAGNNRIKKSVKAKTLPKHFLANLEKILATESSPDEAKKATEQRRKTLQGQRPDKLIRFMIAYPPSVWERGRAMSDGTFRSLLGTFQQQELVMEPELLAAPFFSVVLDKLQAPPDMSSFQLIDNVRAGQSTSSENDFEKLIVSALEELEQRNDNDARSPEAEETHRHVQPEPPGSGYPRVEGQCSDLGIGENSKHAYFPGALRSKVGILPELLLEGLRMSRMWGTEAGPNTNAVQVFVPRNSDQDDGIVTLTLSSSVTWTIMSELGMLSK